MSQHPTGKDTNRDMSRDTSKDRMANRKGALGKGISSLLGDSSEANESKQKEELAAAPTSQTAAPAKVEIKKDVSSQEVKPQFDGSRIVRLPLELIEPNPHQPRKIFADSELKDLAASLKEDGVLQPIVVTATQDKDGHYTLIAGERRLRASKLAGFTTIPAIIKEATPNDMLRLALIENIQRSELNIIEEAEAYGSLIRDFGLTQEQCAEKVGKDRATVANALRLLQLPRELQDDLLEERLTMGHGRALLSLEDKKLILRARDLVLKKQMSVRQTEQLVRSFKDGATTLAKAAGASANRADLEYLAETLRSHLKTKVKVSGNGSRGKIEMYYFSAAELERLLGNIGPRVGR